MKAMRRHLGLHLICFFLIVFAIAGCTVRLVANYDEAIDKSITELQKKVETILTKIERQPSNPSSTYDAKDYEQLREDLNVLRTRAASWDKNEATVKMLYELGYQLLENPPAPVTEDEGKEKNRLDQIVVENSQVPLPTQEYFPLQRRHQMKDSLEPEDIRDLRTILEVHFRRLVSFENLKKRGMSTKTK
jgi:uncharacterized membrane protein YgaE (UPF0421/DUF939 family)